MTTMNWEDYTFAPAQLGWTIVSAFVRDNDMVDITREPVAGWVTQVQRRPDTRQVLRSRIEPAVWSERGLLALSDFADVRCASLALLVGPGEAGPPVAEIKSMAKFNAHRARAQVSA